MAIRILYWQMVSNTFILSLLVLVMATSSSILIAEDDPFVDMIDTSDLIDNLVIDSDIDTTEVVSDERIELVNRPDLAPSGLEEGLELAHVLDTQTFNFFNLEMSASECVPVWNSDIFITDLIDSVSMEAHADSGLEDAAAPDAALVASNSSALVSSSNVWLNGVVKPFKSVVLSATLREVIEQINVEEGDRIEVGQALIHLKSEKQRLAIERYSLVIRKADFDYQAAQRLFEQKVSSRDDVMNKELELKRLIVEQAIAQAEYDERTIKSPLNGVVVKKLKEAGESVNEVEPILQVVENDRLLLLFYLHADMLPLIQLEQELTTRYPALSPDIVKVATINFIDPEVDARSGLFRVRLLLDNSDGSIKPGMRVQAAFPARAHQPGANAYSSSTHSL